MSKEFPDREVPLREVTVSSMLVAGDERASRVNASMTLNSPDSRDQPQESWPEISNRRLRRIGPASERLIRIMARKL